VSRLRSPSAYFAFGLCFGGFFAVKDISDFFTTSSSLVPLPAVTYTAPSGDGKFLK